MPYPPEFVQPMRDDLTRLGVEELTTVGEVDAFLDRPGTKLLIVNSVCGCAAGMARPAVALALRHAVRPDHLGTVFAGQDLEATARARAAFPDVPPSSPSIFVIRDRELVAFLPRHQIERRDAASIAYDLVGAFDEFCASA